MKKLLPVMAIALFISGCENSVNLPNTNMSNVISQPQQTAQFTENDLKEIGLAVVVSGTYRETCSPKVANKWKKFMDERLQSILHNLNNAEKEYVKTYSMGQLIRPYMMENNIPLSGDNGVKLISMVKSDSKLSKAVINASKKNVDAGGLNCVSSVGLLDQKLKSIMGGKIH